HARPFALRRDRMLRILLVRMGPAEHLFGITMHHIASDGWSVGVLVRELAELYGAFSAGRPSPLPPLPIQYADFAAWQRRALAAPALGAELAYWRARLAEAPPTLELPADRPPPAAPSYRGARRHAR